jgi:diadenosine tetraphosphatase ApaH/serine/threonine PP2A family protein phosphatase
VAELRGTCIAGNHDLMALGSLSDERCIPLAQASARWTRGVLEGDARAFLAGLPLSATRDGVALHHGSVGDPEQYVLTEAQALIALDDLQRIEPAADILIVGHTHHPAAVGERSGSLLRASAGAVRVPANERVLLNPGAVGQSRSSDPRARVMVLDLSARVATFHALEYDMAGCREALRARGLPPDSCYRPQSRWDGATGALKRRVRHLQRSLRL